jgi:hypothetical protein
MMATGTKFEDLDDLIALECSGGCGLNYLWSKGYTTEFIEEAVASGYFRWVPYTDDPEQEKANGRIDVQVIDYNPRNYD